MKKLFILFSIAFMAFFVGCKTPETDNPGEYIPTHTPMPTQTPFSTGTSNVQLALYDGEKLMFYDGQEMRIAYYGQVKNAGNRRVAINDYIYKLNEKGNTVSGKYLPAVPDGVTTRSVNASVSRGTEIWSDDVYTLVEIPPEESVTYGWLPRYYTAIYENNELWPYTYLREWRVGDVFTTDSNNIIVQKLGSDGAFMLGWYCLDEPELNVFFAYRDSLLLHSMNQIVGRGNITIRDGNGDHFIDATGMLNFWANGLKEMQYANGKWLTKNGYVINLVNNTITQNTSHAMYVFNNRSTYPAWGFQIGANAVIHMAGVINDGTEDVSYWVECDTGTLFTYRESTNRLYFIVQLYPGDGSQQTGSYNYKLIHPALIENKLYYTVGTFIKTYDLTTGQIAVFAEGLNYWPW